LTYGTGSSQAALAVANLNKDQFPDLAYVGVGPGNNQVHVLLGRADGTFPGSPVDSTIQANTNGQPAGLTEADFNQDGKPDLATALDAIPNSPGMASVVLGRGDGSFSPPQADSVVDMSSDWTTAADFNGDKIPDLAVSLYKGHSLAILIGNGDGTFQPPVLYGMGSAAHFVLADDFNGDKKIDLATADDSSVTVFLGDGNGGFSQSFMYNLPVDQTYTGYALAAGDLNGDGTDDLVLAQMTNSNGNQGRITVLLGQGNGQFQFKGTYEVGTSWKSVAVADVTGDGQQDVIAAGAGGALMVLPGNGDGTLRSPSVLSFGGDHDRLMVTDVNGDKAPDLVVAGDNGVSVLLNQPDARSLLTTEPVPPVASVGSPFSVTVTALSGFGSVAKGYRGMVHFQTISGQADLPADYLFTAADQGQRTFQITPRAVGNLTFTVTDLSNPSLTEQQTITVHNAPASQFGLDDGHTSSVAGVPFSFPVTALDPYFDIATDYRGTIVFSSTDPKASLPTPYPYTASDQGRHSFQVTLRTAGAIKVQVHDAQNTSIMGELDVMISPDQVAQLRLDAPATAFSGDPFDLTVAAVDRFDNVNPSYQGTVHFRSDDTTPGVVPPDYTFTAADQGQHQFPQGATLFQVGDRTIFVQDTAVSSWNAQASINVQAPAVLSGRLDPSSDTGVSQSDGITRVKQPRFSGTTSPGATVRLYEDSLAHLLAQRVADQSGNWSLTPTEPFADGRYTLFATAAYPPLGVVGPAFLLPQPLVIDTIGPRVFAATLDRRTARVTLILQDERSGLVPAELMDTRSYLATTPARKPRRLTIRKVAVPGATGGPGPVRVQFLVTRGPRGPRVSRFRLEIFSSAVTDVAGNPLDGEFHGTFPSGNGQPGGDFLAVLSKKMPVAAPGIIASGRRAGLGFPA
jgi:hypothetical protein